jgi:hypothetical protein
MSAIIEHDSETSNFIRKAHEFFHLRKHKNRRDARVPYELDNWGMWYKLGAGYYGEAWAHGDFPDLVVKISGPAGWGYVRDEAVQECIQVYAGETEPREDAWPHFASVCMKYPHKHLPKIYHLERAGRLAWGVMQRYEEISHWEFDSAKVKQIRRAFIDRRVAEAWMLPLLEVTTGAYVQVDLHRGNIMRNVETGDPVIIDPFSTTGEYAPAAFDVGEFSSTTEYTDTQPTNEVTETC